MKINRTACIAGAAFALYAAAGAVALAQAPAPPGPAARADRQDRVDRGDRPGMRMDRGGPERRDPAAHLRAILQLKPAQEPALTAFLASMKPPEGGMMRISMDRRGGPAGAPGAAAPPAPPRTTPERLALAEKALADHTAIMRGRLDATRKFYDQLDAGQKRAFDELGPMMMGGQMGHMGPAMKVRMRQMPMPPMAPMGPPPKS